MRATFIGDPNDDFSGPKVFTIYGVSFPKDVSVPLDGLDAAQIGKLKGNNHFLVSQTGGDPLPPADPKPETVEIPSGWEDLKWPQLRSLAAKVTKDPVGNKEAALEAIAAEVARRTVTAKPVASQPPKVTGSAEAEFEAWAKGDD